MDKVPLYGELEQAKKNYKKKKKQGAKLCLTFFEDKALAIAEEGNLGSLSAMSSIASQFGFDFAGSENTTFNQNNIIQLLQILSI